MTGLRDQAILWSARLALPRLFSAAPGQGLTTLLFHDFCFGDESWDHARERLRLQLDFLTRRFTPIDLETAVADHSGGRNSAPRVLVTIDDAKRDILKVVDVFDAFAVPVAQFVCAGWSERAQKGINPETQTLCLVSWLRFYDGPRDTVQVGAQDFVLDHDGNTALIDAVIAAPPEDSAALAEREQVTRDVMRNGIICDWDELRDLQAGGMTIGAHSVSHTRIAQHSPQRQAFEIAASQACVAGELGACPWFAYPYGTPDSHNAQTRAILRDHAFDAGFTTYPAVLRADSDPLALPRIALPDAPMDQAIFEARVLGGGVPLARMKEWVS